MMVLSEETTVAREALPLAELRDHLRLGTGFAEEGLQDGLLESYLRAALAAIEARIGKVLMARRFLWVLEDWRDPVAQALPVAPVRSIETVELVDASGEVLTVDPERYRLAVDAHRPRLAARGMLLPSAPADGRVRVRFDAGFGPDWADVPVDLRQAVILLAGEFYERRSEMGLREAGLSFGVMALIEKWRTVRVLGGGAA